MFLILVKQSIPTSITKVQMSNQVQCKNPQDDIFAFAYMKVKKLIGKQVQEKAKPKIYKFFMTPTDGGFNEDYRFDTGRKQDHPMNIHYESLEPFFGGNYLQSRMKIIRPYIVEVRQKYNGSFFHENMQQFIQMYPRFSSQINKIKYSDWDQKGKKQFPLIKMLTIQSISVSILAHIRDLFRSKIDNPDERLKNFIKLSVFLIETINIQLFLLTQERPKLNRFSGTVYRGITVTPADFQKFYDLNSKKSLNQRVISVPLSLWSSSKKLWVALQFLKDRQKKNLVNVILKIQVKNLDQDYLKTYKKYFPESIVSTICAVDISQQSQAKIQQQVLLRGAFCLQLDIKQCHDEYIDYLLIECVMTNASRDHISTNMLGQKGTKARDFFNLINKITRLKYAAQFFEAQCKINDKDKEIKQKFEYFKAETEKDLIKLQYMEEQLQIEFNLNKETP